MRHSKKHTISVIIPAYNQEKTIEADIRRIIEVLEQLRYAYEVIIVVDGKTDETYQKAKK